MIATSDISRNQNVKWIRDRRKQALKTLEKQATEKGKDLKKQIGERREERGWKCYSLSSSTVCAVLQISDTELFQIVAEVIYEFN